MLKIAYSYTDYAHQKAAKAGYVGIFAKIYRNANIIKKSAVICTK